MRKPSNKKGLFLAEILLAVVIAAVIMGSGFLVYTNIQTENEKNTALQNLNMIISMTHPVLGQERGDTDSDTNVKTKLFVQAKMFPNTIETDSSTFRAKSAYGYPLSIGMWETQENSLWRITYNNLDTEECTKFVQAAIKSTRPIALGSETGSSTHPAVEGAYTQPTQTVCGSSQTALTTATTLCPVDSVRNITLVYSPNNEPSIAPACNP